MDTLLKERPRQQLDALEATCLQRLDALEENNNGTTSGFEVEF